MSARGSMSRITLLAAALLACASAEAVAQSKTGTTCGAVLQIEPSARIAAMGNAGVSVEGGLEGAYYNPAAIGALERRQVIFSHNTWLAGIRHAHVAAAMPLGRLGNGYLSITSLNSGDIEVRTVELPNGTGERYHVSNLALGLGIGKQISDRFSAGMQVNYVQETIWNSSAATMMLNVGTQFRVSERGLHIGSSISNFGTNAGFDGRDLRILYDNDPNRYGDNGALPGLRYTDRFPTAVLFRVGIGMPLRFNRNHAVTWAVDGFHPADDHESVSIGTEYKFRELIALRMGYQDLFLEDSETGLTFGAGFHGDTQDFDYKLDYGWADHGRLGSTHRLSFGVSF